MNKKDDDFVSFEEILSRKKIPPLAQKVIKYLETIPDGKYIEGYDKLAQMSGVNPESLRKNVRKYINGFIWRRSAFEMYFGNKKTVANSISREGEYNGKICNRQRD